MSTYEYQTKGTCSKKITVELDGGTTGNWGSWGSNKQSAEAADGGVDDTKCLKLVNKGDGSFWEAQCAYTFGEPLKKDVNYVIKFQARVESGSGESS